MKIRDICLIGATLLIAHSMFRLSSFDAETTAVCCVDDRDCADGDRCDRSRSCGDLPGTCIQIPIR